MFMARMGTHTCSKILMVLAGGTCIGMLINYVLSSNQDLNFRGKEEAFVVSDVVRIKSSAKELGL